MTETPDPSPKAPAPRPAGAKPTGDKKPPQTGGQNAGQKPGQKPGPRAAAISVKPIAGPARLKTRHRGLFMGLAAFVGLPVLLAALYLAFFARDLYASNTGFTVRSEERGPAADLVGGLSSLVGGGASGASNTDVLFAFIQSQEMVERVQAQADFTAHFQQNWASDPVYSLWPDSTIEDVTAFWQRMIRVSYDRASGLMDVQVRARDAAFARRLAQLVVQESEAMINALNAQARRDAMASALADVEAALERLRLAREDLAQIRARTQIVDPTADIQGRMGVINNLQQQLAESLVDYDLLLQTTTENDSRVRQAQRRIEVIQARIDEERQNFATRDVTVFDTDYPRLIAQFESLMVNQHFAEQTYTASLAALDLARSNAQRQSLYLATYISPTLAQRAQYPQRITLVLLVGFFSLLLWAAISVIYYSLRDRG